MPAIAPRLMNVAKMALRTQISELQEAAALEDGKLRKCRRLVRTLRNSEEVLNRRMLTMRKTLRQNQRRLSLNGMHPAGQAARLI
jgi:hypothetical protein